MTYTLTIYVFTLLKKIFNLTYFIFLTQKFCNSVSLINVLFLRFIQYNKSGLTEFNFFYGRKLKCSPNYPNIIIK